MRLTLMDYLSGADVRKTGVLLLVDEAQSLPIRLLEELRVLGNVSHQGVPTVRLLLAGSQSLEETFTEPEIEAFNQRIVARCYLAPLSHSDTAQFIRGHLAAAGAAPDELFTADALDAVYRATDGIARLVNQVCDRALVLAAGHGQLQVTKEIVAGAWADLQQLPTPWNLPDTPAMAEDREDHAEQVIEYGPLSDDHGDMSKTTPFAKASDPPATRMYEPEGEEADDEQGQTVAWSAGQVESKAVVAVEPAEEPSRRELEDSNVPDGISTVDDLFGNDFDEEVVIDEYTSFEQTIPPSRPRVSSACDTTLGQLLNEISHRDAAMLELPDAEIAPVSVAEEFAQPFPGLAVVDESEQDELPIDATEIDEDEVDEIIGELHRMVDEAQQLATPPTSSPADEGEHDTAMDDIDILVIEDEMAIPMNTAAAQRADYRQLFKTLRDN